MDYYRTMAVFFPYVRYDFPLADEETVKRHEAETAAVNARIDPIKKQVADIQAPYRKLARERTHQEIPRGDPGCGAHAGAGAHAGPAAAGGPGPVDRRQGAMRT